MKTLLLFLLSLQIFGIEIVVTENVRQVLKNNFILGSDIVFKKNDRKTSFYVAAQSNIPEQIIANLDVKKGQGTISRFLTLKGLEKNSKISKIALLPDDLSWGLDLENLLLYKINLKSGEIYSKLDLKKFVNTKILDFTGDNNSLALLTLDPGLNLVKINLKDNKSDKINLSKQAFTNASIVLTGKDAYIVHTTINGSNEVYSSENNTFNRIDAWRDSAIQAITLMDDGKTIAYMKGNQLVYRMLPQAVIVWGSKEWILVVILSIITVLGFSLLYKVITK